MPQYITDTEHYSEVISRIPKVKRLLWITAADLNDLYVKKSVLSMTAPNRCAYCLTKCRNVVATFGTGVWIRHNLRHEEKNNKKTTQAGGVGNQHLPLALSTFLWQNSQIFGTNPLPCRRFVQYYYRDTFIKSHRKPIDLPQIVLS